MNDEPPIEEWYREPVPGDVYTDGYNELTVTDELQLRYTEGDVMEEVYGSYAIKRLVNRGEITRISGDKL